MRLLLGLALLLTSATPSTAQTSRIAWANDVEWTNCYTVAPLYQTTTLYLLAQGEDFVGAEFRATGLVSGPTLPSGLPTLLWTVQPSPFAGVTLGDPTGAGCNIAFASCQSAVTPVLLYSVNVIPFADTTPYYVLDIEAHSTPSSPNFPCPLFNLCDAPVFTLRCVGTAGFTLEVGQSRRTPTDPTPANDATDVPINTTLSVGNLGTDSACHAGIAFQILYFGTSADPPREADSEFCTPHCFSNPYSPGLLLPDTTYYWKVKHCGNDGVCSDSELWSFTTTATVNVEGLGWSQVKDLYR